MSTQIWVQWGTISVKYVCREKSLYISLRDYFVRVSHDDVIPREILSRDLLSIFQTAKRCCDEWEKLHVLQALLLGQYPIQLLEPSPAQPSPPLTNVI